MKGTWKGVNTALRNFERLDREMTEATKAAAVDLAREAVDRMIREVPVDTGELRDSIEMTVLPNGVSIKATAFHALFVEFGTRKMPAQPFFHHNIDIFKKEFHAAWVAELRSRGL